MSDIERIRVEAFAISGTVALPKLAKIFPDAKVTKTELVLQLEENSWMVVHDFGAIVFFNVEETTKKKSIDSLRQVTGETRELVSEEFYMRVYGAARPSVLFDHIDIPELTRPIVELVALVIGQSVALEYYEEDVDRILGEIDRFSLQLEQRGRMVGAAKELLKFVGRANVVRNRAVYTIALLDSPLLVWNDESLDKMHTRLRGTFAIRDRYEALEQKLRVIRDSLELFVDLAQERRSFWLEVSVIGLIAFEILIALIGKH